MQLVGSVFFVLIFFVFPIFMVLVSIYRYRVVSLPYDKSIIYLASEMTFDDERWKEIKAKVIGKEVKKIRVPISTTWAAMVTYPFSSIGKIGSICVGIFLLVFTAYLIMMKIDLRSVAVELINLSFYVVWVLCWFVYYFRSFSAVMSDVEERSIIAMKYLLDLGWGEIDIDVLDTIKDEIKSDFDLFKKEGSIGAFIVLAASTLTVFYSRISKFEIDPFAINIVLFFGSVYMSRWMYEAYRTRIIYIGLSAVLSLKKKIQRDNANKSSHSAS